MYEIKKIILRPSEKGEARERNHGCETAAAGKRKNEREMGTHEWTRAAAATDFFLFSFIFSAGSSFWYSPREIRIKIMPFNFADLLIWLFFVSSLVIYIACRSRIKG